MIMTKSEFNERIAALEAKKKGLERNRNICILVLVFLSYNAWKSIREGTPPLWFYFAMGIVLFTLAGLAFTGHRSSLKTGNTIQALLHEAEKEALFAENEVS